VKADLPDKDIFERHVVISDALRHPETNDLFMPGDTGASYTDTGTKKIQMDILWAPDYLPMDLISHTIYVTNWMGQVAYGSSSLVISNVSPSTDDNFNDQSVSYALNEAASYISVVFTRTDGAVDGVIHTCVLQGAALTSGIHSGLALNSTNCGSWTSLVNGAIYTVTFAATDLDGNPATEIIGTLATFDNSAPTTTGAITAGNCGFQRLVHQPGHLYSDSCRCVIGGCLHALLRRYRWLLRPL